MSDIGSLGSALLQGSILGDAFFGGLWWTVRHGLISPHPALWFALSALVRMAAVFTGLYWIARSGFIHLLVCLLGILIARITIIRLTHSTALEQLTG